MIRPLLLVCAGLLQVCVLLLFRQTLAALVLAAGLAPLATLLAWQVHKRVHLLHNHARLAADSAAEAELHYFQVLRGVVQAIEARDKHQAGRSERISRLVESVGRQVNLDPDRLQLLTMIAQVHDIGLLSVPSRVLEKPTGLSGSEFHTVQQHTDAGHRMLQPLRFLEPVLGAVRYHHERMNGTGYPKGLFGDAIPLEARILAVADAYDAMTHDRPHRRALSTQAAMKEILRCSGDGFDPACVAALANAVNLSHLLPKQADADQPVPDAPSNGGLTQLAS